jgi:serine/threonine protein kinase
VASHHELMGVTFQVDIWALGVVAVILSAGRRNLERKGHFSIYGVMPREQIDAILSLCGEMQPTLPALGDFISRCLTRDEAARWSAEQLTNHILFTGVKRERSAVMTHKLSSGAMLAPEVSVAQIKLS